MLRKELHLDLEPSVFWTDSQTVLKYIGSDHARFKTYVANRVSLICENTDQTQWRHVSGKENPVDDASRGLSAVKFIQQRRWLHAPDVPWKTEESWPTDMLMGTQLLLQVDPELKKNVAVFTTTGTENPTDNLLSYFSDWQRLLRAVAWYQGKGKECSLCKTSPRPKGQSSLAPRDNHSQLKWQL